MLPPRTPRPFCQPKPRTRSEKSLSVRQIRQAILVVPISSTPNGPVRPCRVRVGERRWNLLLNNNASVLLPEGHEIAALERLMQLQQGHALLDRPLAAIDLRLPDRLVVRPRADAETPAPLPPKKPT